MTSSYPNGDVPIDRGVCTEVIIRALRAVEIDLQRLIHEDMSKNFSKYPKNWGLSRPDKNIDHPRIPNIAHYLQRTGKQLPITRNAREYLPGDIVTWKLPGNLDHIGMVSNSKINSSERYAVIHNIGNGAKNPRHIIHVPNYGSLPLFSHKPINLFSRKLHFCNAYTHVGSTVALSTDTT